MFIIWFIKKWHEVWKKQQKISPQRYLAQNIRLWKKKFIDSNISLIQSLQQKQVNKRNKVMEEPPIHSNAYNYHVMDKNIIKILKKLDESNQQERYAKLNEVLLNRRNKKLFVKKKSYRFLAQDAIKPGDAIPRMFSEQTPISKNVPFLNEKEKKKVLDSNRVYTKMPNIVSGKYFNKFISHTYDQERQITQRKFQDYDRIVTEQVGPLRLNLHRRRQSEEPLVHKKPIYSTKRVSTFSTYESDNNNYYKDPDSSFKKTMRAPIIELKYKSAGLKRIRSNRTKTEGQNLINFNQELI